MMLIAFPSWSLSRFLLADILHDSVPAVPALTVLTARPHACATTVLKQPAVPRFQITHSFLMYFSKILPISKALFLGCRFWPPS